MSDMMNFPETWEEYEKLYGFNDSEEIYTNNSRLIPSFRVKQWIEHESKQENKQQAIKASDCISRQKAIDAIVNTVSEIGLHDNSEVARYGATFRQHEIIDIIEGVPSEESEPLSDAYMKAVWTWLINYQIKVAELKGRYTPYEVLSWVANDWRKENKWLNQS
jgi:hypothetical protein